MHTTLISRMTLLSRLAGSILVLAGAIWLIWQGLFVARANRVPGVVVSVGELVDDSSTRVVSFRFTDTNGAVQIGSSSYFSNETCPAVHAGETVLILVDRLSKRAEINSFPALWSCPIFTVSVGIIFVLGGYLMSLTARVTAQRQRLALKGGEKK